jgi:transcriptional regulator with XRE-family HTH domain
MNLKEQRKLLGFTQQSLATACGVSMATVRMWEYGMPPTEENRKKLEEVLANATTRPND